MSVRVARLWIAASGMLLACAGCGFKGPLYLPERSATVVTRPNGAGQAAQSGGQTQTPATKGKSKTSSSPPPAPSSSGSPPPSAPQNSGLPQSPPPQSP
ncbi:MAG TPA: lipoprotein [Steroidobacteraceae bacterium]|nr:lipoprotein [Steroidobacteraceae bacterium]